VSLKAQFRFSLSLLYLWGQKVKIETMGKFVKGISESYIYYIPTEETVDIRTMTAQLGIMQQ
jgi:hypothetical protein